MLPQSIIHYQQDHSLAVVNAPADVHHRISRELKTKALEYPAAAIGSAPQRMDSTKYHHWWIPFAY